MKSADNFLCSSTSQKKTWRVVQNVLKRKVSFSESCPEKFRLIRCILWIVRYLVILWFWGYAVSNKARYDVF